MYQIQLWSCGLTFSGCCNCIGIIAPLISYGKFKYWITNYRVVGGGSTIGYSVESIPLENINDVIINRSNIVRFLGLAPLLIVPLGGFGGYGRNGGNITYFLALKPKQALELQALIFKLRDVRKKD